MKVPTQTTTQFFWSYLCSLISRNNMGIIKSRGCLKAALQIQLFLPLSWGTSSFFGTNCRSDACVYSSANIGLHPSKDRMVSACRILHDHPESSTWILTAKSTWEYLGAHSKMNRTSLFELLRLTHAQTSPKNTVVTYYVTAKSDL